MTYLIKAKTTTGAGQAILNNGPARTFQAVVTGAGAVSATVAVEVSNNGAHFITLSTLTLSGTNVGTDGFASDAPWKYMRANVTAISGTGAAVDVIMGS